jgi:phospholipid-binding lipoprotein MlaA
MRANRQAAPWRRGIAWLCLLFAAVASTGCASVPADAGGSRRDPFERMNRKVFAFNEALDEAVVKPLAEGYKTVVPQPVRNGVGNFFGNLGDGWTTFNLFLQAKPQAGLNMGMRTLVNSVLGLGGVLEVAEELGLERTTYEDLGQTLGRWGVHGGPYLMLPGLGPSTLRDASVLVLDVRDSGATYLLKDARDRTAATLMQVLNTRARLLEVGRLLDDIALDKYVLMRDAFMARRRSLVYDGELPEDEPPPPTGAGKQ